MDVIVPTPPLVGDVMTDTSLGLAKAFADAFRAG
jgi:hypothetical protein